MILLEKLCKIINFDSNQSTTLSAIFWFSASSKSLQCSIFKYRRRLQDVLDCHPPTAAAKKPPTLTSTLLQQAVKVVVKLQDGRRYIVSDWQWRLCMSWSAPQVPPPERRQVQLGLYMAAALKGRQPLGRPLLESWNRAWYSGLLNNSVTTRTLKADDLKSWAPFSNCKLVRLASLKDVEVSNFFHWKTAAGLPLKQQM